jgi:drug/metabolite transporter (DMT)-like permease
VVKNLENVLKRVSTEAMSISDRLKIVFVTFLWSLCYPLIKVGLSSGTSPLLFGSLRTAIAALVFFCVALWRKEKISQASRYKLYLIIIGLMAFVAYFGMFVGGSNVNPGLASVIGNSHPIMASLLAVYFLTESLSSIKVTGLFFGFIGIVLISVPTFYGETSNNLTGIVFVFIGALGVAAGNVFLKKFSKSNFPISVLAIQFMLCSVFLFSSALISKDPFIIKWNLEFSSSLIILSVIGTAIADIIWLDLLKRNSLTKLNVYIFLTPAFSLVIGIIFFNEKIGAWEIVGIGAILIGVFMVIERKIENTNIKKLAFFGFHQTHKRTK